VVWRPLTQVLEEHADSLASAVRVVLNPPLIRIGYAESLTKLRGVGLPPQPERTLVRKQDLVKRLGFEGAVELFLAVDQVVSLLPLSVLESLKRMEGDEVVETLFEWSEKMDRVRSEVGRLRVEDLRSEDDAKRRVLLVAPGRRQLEVVKGEWRRWVWSPRTLRGDPAPDHEAWMEELIGIGNALLEEGVRVVFAVDEDDEERFLELSGRRFETVTVRMPPGKAKIGYARDQSVVWFRLPIICNMALEIRVGEEPLYNELYWRLGLPPALRPRWVNRGEHLERCVLEGGNFILVRGDDGYALFTGMGVRGTNAAALKTLSETLPPELPIYAVPLSGYIKDWRATGTVHLDVAVLYGGRVGGQNVMLVDPGRIGFYSVLRYLPEQDAFVPEELGQVARSLGITLDEPPRKGASRITMVNALNLGGGKLVVDPYNEAVNRYLEREWGFELVEVPVPQLDAGGGGVRCATREIEYA